MRPTLAVVFPAPLPVAATSILGICIADAITTIASSFSLDELNANSVSVDRFDPIHRARDEIPACASWPRSHTRMLTPILYFAPD